MKISFDFDGTLEYSSVFNYAIELKNRGVDVWVCTNRLSDSVAPNPYWNVDVYKITNKIGIPKSNIIFMGLVNKYKYFKDNDFVWHLDDNFEDADNITEHTNTTGIRYYSKGDWKEQCEFLLKL